ncbi:TetR/AcrR family transcriptional regulator [Oceanobacillus damuensis]|uniref:TetR/AcrR family transcriptional regulator n=1 Tax=Oceanobacillus damuensis TaxID=937928 RepID=UPI000830415A|nr:TetR/AcrR family transcriptional regulator [Oceanobacillus damuensis]
MSLREKKTAKKKEEIISTAVSIIAEKGYQRTTMEDIASRLLMTKGSVYYYFKDKQDLLFQSHQLLLERSIENIHDIQQLDIPITEKLKQSMIAHIDHLISEKSGFELMLKPEQYFSDYQLQEIQKLREDYSRCFDQLIAEGIGTGIFVSLDKKIVRNLVLGAMNWITQWYSLDGKLGKEEMSETISDYLMRILIKKK